MYINNRKLAVNKVEIRSQVNELLTDDAFLQADSKRRDGGCQVFNTQPFFFTQTRPEKQLPHW